MSTQEFTVNAAEPVGEMWPFWHVANWNKPFRCLDVARMERLAGYAPFTDALNCVYILGGRQVEHNVWFKGLKADGELDVDFTGLIEQLQACMDQRYTPWIVLDNVPYAMSDPPGENFYGNTEPPADERVWHAYVKAAIEAMVEAFGAEMVGGWWFRVGTEPDLLPGHWSGTKQQYFDHYDYTVDAVASVLPEAKIGPGNILNPVEGEYGIIVRDQWGLDIIDHCATGTNACTGGVGAKMDWFSCSWYGRVGVPLSKFDKAIALMRDRLGRYEQLADTPIMIGEFTVLHDETGTRLYSGDTTEWSTSFYAGIADRVYHYGLGEIFEWHHATNGVLHPKGHVITMMKRMVGGDRLAVAPALQPETDCGVIAVTRDDALYLLIYRHLTDRDNGETETFTVTVDGLPDAAALTADITEWTVDATHASWAYEFAADCEAAGVAPIEGAGRYEGGIEFIYGWPGYGVWRANRAKYAAISVLPQTSEATATVSDDGKLTVTAPMPGHSVRLVRLGAAST